MAELFGHEKLIVYQKGMQFAAFRGDLLASFPKRVAAYDHLERGAESILVNIAHASNLWSYSTHTLKRILERHTYTTCLLVP